MVDLIRVSLKARYSSRNQSIGYAILRKIFDESIRNLTMDWDFLRFLEKVDATLFKQGEFAVEKECLRTTSEGRLSQKSHPDVLGSPLYHPWMSLDYGEAQPELITPVFTSLRRLLSMVKQLHCELISAAKEELIWTLSPPCRVLSNEEFAIANFGKTEEANARHAYRRGLKERYGNIRQAICGTHFNFSFPDIFIEDLHGKWGRGMPLILFRSKLYLHMIRNFERYSWLSTYLFGASPVCDDSLICRSQYGDHAVSLRQSPFGYARMQEGIEINLNSFEALLRDLTYYLTTDNPKYRSLEGQLNAHYLQTDGEWYVRARPKPKEPHRYLQSLQESGIQYIEVRCLDNNPEHFAGMDKHLLRFYHMFLLYCLCKESPPLTKQDKEKGQMQLDEICMRGRKMNSALHSMGKQMLAEMEPLAKILGYSQTLALQMKKLNNPLLTPSGKMAASIKELGFTSYALQMAKKEKEQAAECKQNERLHHKFHALAKQSHQTLRNQTLKEEYLLKGYEDMEVSTQMLLREAIRRKLPFEILDRKDNFIKLNGLYIKKATMTCRDHLISYLKMENKSVTKLLLQKEGISVPQGSVFYTVLEGVKNYERFRDKKAVVKPIFTNYGHGISIVTPQNPSAFENALKRAFVYGKEVIVEEFIEGEEYRFLVINGSTSAVCRRIPANVEGDGIHTIRQLVRRKNYDPAFYKMPKYPIVIGKYEQQFLKKQGLTLKSIPKCGENVFLRDNSNVSTGGDPIDCTEEVCKTYKDIAERAASIIEAKFCGVDMIIASPEQKPSAENHAIIELNFNPALWIHRYVVKGKMRHVEKDVLDYLFKNLNQH